MVSSFRIRTNVLVPAPVRARFNAYSAKIRRPVFEMRDDPHLVRNYFDHGWLRTGVACLESFLEEEKTAGCPKVPIHEAGFANNWRVGNDGILMDNSEKFHGAMSMLHYMVDTFFEPEGVKLSGTVVGVNTERPLTYVYHVKDNAITLDEARTRLCLEVYEFWSEKVQDDAEVEVIHAMMARDVFSHQPRDRFEAPPSAPLR